MDVQAVQVPYSASLITIDASFELLDSSRGLREQTAIAIITVHSTSTDPQQPPHVSVT